MPVHLPPLRTLHLFAGAGGSTLTFDLLGLPSVGAVENDPFCKAVLEARGETIVGSDIREYHPVPGTVDLVCGGFPCQDVSFAGKRAGLAGARSGLWREMLRVWQESEAPYLFAENVLGLLSQGGGADYAFLLGSLARVGADAVWCVLPASCVGTPHRRERWFLLAHSANGGRKGGLPQRQPVPDAGEGGSEMGHPARERRERDRASGQQEPEVQDDEGLPRRAGAGGGPAPHAEVEPVVGRAVDGLAHGMDWPARRGLWPSGKGEPQEAWEAPRTVTADLPGRNARLRALGNGWVPQQAALAFLHLWKALHK